MYFLIYDKKILFKTLNDFDIVETTLDFIANKKIKCYVISPNYSFINNFSDYAEYYYKLNISTFEDLNMIQYLSYAKIEKIMNMSDAIIVYDANKKLLRQINCASFDWEILTANGCYMNETDYSIISKLDLYNKYEKYIIENNIDVSFKEYCKSNSFVEWNEFKQNCKILTSLYHNITTVEIYNLTNEDKQIIDIAKQQEVI